MSTRDAKLLKLLEELKEIGEHVKSEKELEQVIRQYEDRLLTFLINDSVHSTEKSTT